MKKILFTLILILSCQMVCAQEASSMFNQYKTAKNVEYMNIPISEAVNEPGETMQKLAEQLETVEMLNLGECRKSVRKRFERNISKLTSKGYIEYTRIKDGDDLVLVLMKQGGDFVDEIIILIKDSDDCMALLVKGHINKEDIGDLIRMVGK